MDTITALTLEEVPSLADVHVGDVKIHPITQRSSRWLKVTPGSRAKQPPPDPRAELFIPALSCCATYSCPQCIHPSTWQTTQKFTL